MNTEIKKELIKLINSIDNPYLLNNISVLVKDYVEYINEHYLDKQDKN